MYILSISEKEKEGAYALTYLDGEKSLCLFQEKDDATRYAGLLEAEDFPPMAVVEIPDELAIDTCKVYNYRYVVISENDFVIPPINYDNIQKDKMA